MITINYVLIFVILAVLFFLVRELILERESKKIIIIAVIGWAFVLSFILSTVLK